MIYRLAYNGSPTVTTESCVVFRDEPEVMRLDLPLLNCCFSKFVLTTQLWNIRWRLSSIQIAKIILKKHRKTVGPVYVIENQLNSDCWQARPPTDIGVTQSDYIDLSMYTNLPASNVYVLERHGKVNTCCGSKSNRFNGFFCTQGWLLIYSASELLIIMVYWNNLISNEIWPFS